MAQNVLRGGGKAQKEAVQGLKELERKLKQLATSNPEMKFALQQVVAAGAKEMRDEMASQARAKGWGSQHITARIRTDLSQRGRTPKGFAAGGISGGMAVDSIFSYGRPRRTENPRQRISALAGVTKPETMVEWTTPGINAASAKAGRPRKRAKGETVAMAFATMLEFGTSRMKARPAIRPAVKAARERIVAKVAEQYRSLLDKFSK